MIKELRNFFFKFVKNSCYQLKIPNAHTIIIIKNGVKTQMWWIRKYCSIYVYLLIQIIILCYMILSMYNFISNYWGIRGKPCLSLKTSAFPVPKETLNYVLFNANLNWCKFHFGNKELNCWNLYHYLTSWF